MRISLFYSVAYKLLMSYKSSYLFTFLLFMLINFLLISFLLTASSLRQKELNSLALELELQVQNTKAGIKSFSDDYMLYESLGLKGVKKGVGCVEGEYYFAQNNSKIKIVGVDFFGANCNSFVDEIAKKHLKTSNTPSVFVSLSVAKMFAEFHFDSKINLFTPSALSYTLDIVPLDLDMTHLDYPKDVMFCEIGLARELLGLGEFEYSSFFVDIPNTNESAQIAKTLQNTLISANIKTKKQRESAIYKKYNFYSGFFIVLYLVVLVSFMILIYLQNIFLINSQKKTIGILRALGYKISSVIWLKTLQNLFLAFGAFVVAVIFSFVFVFVLDAPLLKSIFTQQIQTPLVFVWGLGDIILVGLLSITAYMASVLIPVWKLSIIEPSESLK